MTRIRKMMQKQPIQYLCLVFVALFSAMFYEVFVYPNQFAPAGINGFATIIQHLLGISVGYISFVINVPMLIVAFFLLNRSYALKNLLYIICFSVFSVLLHQMDLSFLIFDAQDGGGAILAAVAGGFFSGFFYAVCVRLGGSTGGTDIMGAMINHKWPEYDTVWIIFAINALIAVLSFFVYGMTYEPVILCIIYNFVAGRVSDSMLKGGRMAAKFEVVTNHPNELAADLMKHLRHACTVVPAKGMYSGEERSMLICVVHRRQIVEFEKIIQKYDGTFAIISTVNGIFGRFRSIEE